MTVVAMEQQDKKQVSYAALLNCCLRRRRDVNRTASGSWVFHNPMWPLSFGYVHVFHSSEIYFPSYRENKPFSIVHL